jgi:tetratricopeptide (TPR) repeat protein
MTSPSTSYISRLLISLLFVAGLVLTPNLVRAQELSQEEKEYKALEAIQAEKDPTQKTNMVVKLLRENPKTTYRPNAVAEFQKVVVDLQREKKWSQVITLGEKFIDVAPEDSITVKALAAAYSETKNTRGFATFGEKAYASSPSGQLAFAIAQAYLTLGNDPKFLQWGEKTLAAQPDNVEIMSDMIRRSMATQNQAQALKYARTALKALPTAKKREGVDETTWKNIVSTTYATAYATIGASAYENKNYTEAITNLDNAVKYFKRNDTAYYYLGMAYWQQNKLQPAMLNFAKAYVIKGATSSTAKKYLDQLWSSSHRGSLAGVDQVIQRAQTELK